MTPRFPVNVPRSGTAWMSPNGSTRFCSGMAGSLPRRIRRMISDWLAICCQELHLRVLVVENFDNTELGQVGVALREAGAEIDLRRAQHGDPLPDAVDGHDAIVVLGGGQNALADDECPWFPKLLDLLR